MNKLSIVDPLRYKEVKEWLDAVTEKAMTRMGYTRSMALFLEFTGWTPEKILQIKKEGLKRGERKTEVESKIIEFLRHLQQVKKPTGEGGYSPGTVVAARTALGSFLSYHGHELPKKFIRLSQDLAKETRVPEQNEIEAMIQYSPNLEVKALLTIAADTPCRSRVFVAMEWSWLEPGWEEKDIAHIQIPRKLRPTESGPKKFEPIAFIGKKGIAILQQLKSKRFGTEEATGRIFPFTPDWFQMMPTRVFEKTVKQKAIRPSAPNEQAITLKSFRKYSFNVIDALRDISPEWRNMLKGRDLGVEKYYSKEYIEKLREVYKTKIYPAIWKEQAAMDKKVAEFEAARRVLLAVGIDADAVLKSQPKILTLEDKVKFLDEQIKQLGLSRYGAKDGGIAITQKDKEAIAGFFKFLKRMSTICGEEIQ